MKPESLISPVLYWPSKRDRGGGLGRGDSLYQSARKEIFRTTGQMPRIVTTEPDIQDFFTKHPNAILYIPVFVESTGWWGGLLGADPSNCPCVTDKIILSADCQLMAIQIAAQKLPMSNQLFTAEIHPSSQFFKKMNSQIAMSIDMLATDTGTILGLFSGKNRKKFTQLVESTGNSYLGCIGWY
ncbi:MAG: hypothetical protein FWG80_04535 [Alphaproteobacteria bacterium]|nr:hypothetical protein [Alphaproteobacteria bacterium]